MDVLSYAIIGSPIGRLMLAGDGSLRHVSFLDRPDSVKPGDDWVRDDRGYRDVVAQLSEYFAGRRRTFDVPLALDGTPFQLAVWDEMQGVPYGNTVTYGDLARRLHSVPRAVGQATGANPLPILVPCHRIVALDGRLQGYRGGIEAKRYLLGLESRQQRLF